MNYPTDDRGDVDSSRVGANVKNGSGNGREALGERSVLISCVAIDMSRPPSYKWFCLHIHHHRLSSLWRHCVCCHRRRFLLCIVHTGSGVSDPIDNRGHDGSSSVGTRRKIAGGEGEGEDPQYDGDVLYGH